LNIGRRSLLYRANAGPLDAAEISDLCERFLALDAFQFTPNDFRFGDSLVGPLRSELSEHIARRIIAAGQKSGCWVSVAIDPPDQNGIGQQFPTAVRTMHQRGWLEPSSDGWRLSHKALLAIATYGNGKYLSPDVRVRFADWKVSNAAVSALQVSTKHLSRQWNWEASRMSHAMACSQLSKMRERADGYKVPFMAKVLEGGPYIGVSIASVRSLKLESWVVKRIEEMQDTRQAREALQYLSNASLSPRLEFVAQQG
jgi:hypothetical protein